MRQWPLWTFFSNLTDFLRASFAKLSARECYVICKCGSTPKEFVTSATGDNKSAITYGSLNWDKYHTILKLRITYSVDSTSY